MKKLLFIFTVILAFAGCSQNAEEKPVVKEDEPKDVVLEDKLTDFDDQWNVFRSQTKQYSLKVPKETKTWDCEGKEVIVPVTVLGSEEFDLVTTVDSYLTDDSGKCEKVLATMENADSDAWKIFVADAQTDEDLDKFIKKQFGQTCGFQGKEPAGKGGIFNVELKTTGPDVAEEEMCFINWITNVKFDPIFKKVAKFDIGQDGNFYDKEGNPVDMEMAESFLFEAN